MKTFEQCCDEVAKKQGFENYKEARVDGSWEFVDEREAAELLVKEAIELAREKMSNDSNSFSSFMGTHFYKHTEQEILDKLFKP